MVWHPRLNDNRSTTKIKIRLKTYLSTNSYDQKLVHFAYEAHPSACPVSNFHRGNLSYPLGRRIAYQKPKTREENDEKEHNFTLFSLVAKQAEASYVQRQITLIVKFAMRVTILG